MELQHFVDTSPNYLNLLKSKKFIIRRFYKYGLYLIKYSEYDLKVLSIKLIKIKYLSKSLKIE